MTYNVFGGMLDATFNFNRLLSDSSGYRPWEVESLHLEVGVEAVLNLFQQVVGLDQSVEHVGLVGDHEAVGVFD